MGEKGRFVIPIAVRQAAGVGVGDELIARVLADGRIVLETRAAIAKRIRARFAGEQRTERHDTSGVRDTAAAARRTDRAAFRPRIHIRLINTVERWGGRPGITGPPASRVTPWRPSRGRCRRRRPRPRRRPRRLRRA
ncbi:AbrB/MazE/SpoVT family DNA-binding domain-containing protein [Luedemannella flava]|uniref:AbrB/MazE/SpoVT family DNA-binding domain-containing protein n=1 Tax=Luedemannella flava TaxID=349316 RepID=UPI00361C9D6C